jgi:hypothetical protein
MDFLDERRDEPLDVRVIKIQEVFSAAQDQEELGHSIFPEEVLAAAAVVAASLPSGGRLPWNGEDSLASALIPEESAVGMAGDALRSVDLAATYQNSWWRESWTSDEDRHAAKSALTELRDVLLSAA